VKLLGCFLLVSALAAANDLREDRAYRQEFAGHPLAAADARVTAVDKISGKSCAILVRAEFVPPGSGSRMDLDRRIERDVRLVALLTSLGVLALPSAFTFLRSK
jgi:hypothetical protein